MKLGQKTWEFEHFNETYSGHEKPHYPLDWTNAAL